MSFLRKMLAGIVFGVALASSAWGQREPHVGYVYPAGGQQGTTFSVVIGGQYFNNAADLFITGTGVSAKVAEQERPLTPKEAQELRDQLAKLQDKRSKGQCLTPDEQKTAQELKKKLEALGRRRASPALGEFVTVEITIDAHAALGKREVRLATPGGLSNPMAFYVGQLPEFTKPDWKSSVRPDGSKETVKPAANEIAVTLPATLNGQIPPGGGDKYCFPARAGQQLLVAASARELIPYLADAVPGWFQATLTLYDDAGNELAYADAFEFHPDPVLFYKIPKDGDYVLEIKDSLYRGREDFVYRVNLGELPFITGVFPLGGKVGSPLTLGLSGWNLPLSQTTPDLGAVEGGAHFVSAGPLSNRLPFALDTLPEIVASKANNTLASAQKITLPIIINGRVEKPGDWDVFAFDGKAGDTVVAEVCARRLGSPLDSVLKLTDAAGKQLAFNDDYDDKAAGLETHHADSYLSFVLPSSGTYYVHLGDAEHNGGAAYGYRLRISAPRPDFELRVVPSAINVRVGASAPVTVYALRKDGFTGEIALSLKDLPAGLKLSAARVPANQDKVSLTLSAAPAATTQPVSLTMEGSAKIQGRQVVRAAVPADDMMQAFAYRHLVPAQTWEVTATGRFRPRDTAQIVSATPIRIPAGKTARIEVSMPAGQFADTLQFELDPASPDGFTIQKQTPTTIVVQSDAAKVKPGQKGNLIILAFIERSAPTTKPATPGNHRRVPSGALPAVPFEIVPP